MTETTAASQQHASMMISYSRKDKEFVQQLHKSLLKSGIPEENIWIDWEDIPAAADWMDEITRAIGGADTFIFVISPASLDSKVCGDEVRVASENNKKFIPILHREPTKENTLPEGISRTNWVYMRQNDDYDAAFPLLLEAINTDLEWVREHTRLLERAIEWGQQGEDKSFLLRGSDLDTAETWQSDATEGKEPQPTHLQAVYIQNSREDAKRRRRNLLISVSIALLVSIVLGITAVIQWLNFQTQSQMNLVRQLAAQATSKQEERLDLASLLSLEANRLSEIYTNSTDQTRAEVNGSLLSVVMHKPELNGYIYGHTAQVYAVDMNLETGIITTASADGTVRLIDLDTLTLIHLFEKEDEKLISAEISPDGTQIAIGSDYGSVSVWDAGTHELVREFVPNEQRNRIRKIMYSPDGSTIAAVDDDGTVVEYDAETLEEIQVYNANDYDYGVAYGPAGETLAIGSIDGYIEIYDLQNGEVIQTVDTGVDTGARSVAFNREGTLMASGGGNGLVQLWDVETGENLGKFEHPGTIIVNSLVFDPAGAFLAVGTDSRDVLLVPLTSDGSGFGEDVNFLSAHVGEIFSIAISDDSNLLLSGGIDQTAILWNVTEGLESGGSSMQVTYPYPEGDVNEVEFSPDGNWLAYASDDSTVYVQDLTDDEAEVEELSAHEAPVRNIAIHPGSNTFASSDTDGMIFLWDTDTGEVIGEMQQDSAYSPLAFSPDGSLLAAGSDDSSVILWDTTQQEPVATLSGAHEDGVLSVAFSPDGSLLASSSLDFNIVLWDVATGEPVRTITTLSQVPTVLFSHDGQQLFSGGYDAMIRVWDVNTGDPVTQLAGHLGDVNEMAFSSDGKMLVSGSADGTVILWDMTSLERIGFLSGSPYSIIGVAFSPTQPLVAAASRDDNVYTWDVSLDAWKKFACFRANRNLTQAEWNQYFGDQVEYHLTCPDFPPPADLASAQN